MASRLSLPISLCQSLALASHLGGYRAFRRALGNTESVQRAKLRAYLRSRAGAELGADASWSYEQFAERMPVTRYADYESRIARLRETQACPRFEPTSGSTDRRKWIPYTPELLAEFDLAAAAWITDLTIEFPELLLGSHYWSLSWLPTELRGAVASTDDLELFPAWKRALMARVMAVPGSVARLPTLEDSWLATLTHLADREDLCFVSVWSPTFLLRLLEELSRRRDEVASRAGPRARALLRAWDGQVDAGFFRALWPRLSVVSCWDSSTSTLWASELRARLPFVRVQPKGIWATEGVVTIPYQERHVLALTSHFFEFRLLDSGRIVPAWELRAGMQAQPLLTTGSGFFRYALEDRVAVTGFLKDAPCLAFRGRLGGTDLVGEKLDLARAAEVLATLGEAGLGRCVTLLARASKGERPGYWVLAEKGARASELAALAERLLLESHHYRLARELGQLEAARVLEREDALAFYERLGSSVAGARKVEPVVAWEGGL